MLMTRIRLSKSSLGMEEKEALLDVLESEFLGMGAETKKFEDELNAFIGLNREVISVNSGTSALNLAFSCLNLGPGDEVIVPSLTRCVLSSYCYVWRYPSFLRCRIEDQAFVPRLQKSL